MTSLLIVVLIVKTSLSSLKCVWICDNVFISLWSCLCHVTLLYVLLLIIILSQDTFTEDTSEKTTNEKDRPGLTPENTTRTAKVGSHVSEVQRALKFEHGKRVLSFAS